MHTSLLGPVNLEAGLQQYVFIRLRKYYERADIIEVIRHGYNWPPGTKVPDIGAYVEEGVKGNLPSPTGSLHYTASQARHWLEHGTSVMEIVFARKACCPCFPTRA